MAFEILAVAEDIGHDAGPQLSVECRDQLRQNHRNVRRIADSLGIAGKEQDVQSFRCDKLVVIPRVDFGVTEFVDQSLY